MSHYPLPGILVDPAGESMTVSITSTATGAIPTVTSDAAGQHTVTMPASIITPTVFYVPNPGTWSVNGIAVTVGGTEVATVQNPFGTTKSNVINVASPTGVAATDTANIQAAINACAPNYGGTVQLQFGTYEVSSFARLDSSISYSGSLTWTDSSMTAADAVKAASPQGLYVICVGLIGRVPKILTVTPGTGFTTDIAPLGTVSSATGYIVQPGLTLPTGTAIAGGSGVVGGDTGDYFVNTGALYGTRVVDTGSGITIVARGSESFGGPIKLSNLAIWGGNGAMGSAVGGFYLGNNYWEDEINRCDFQWYNVFGSAGDGNVNNQSWYRCTWANIASATTTATATGGHLNPLMGAQTSAALDFYECSWFDIYGMGVGASVQDFGQIGTLANLYGCQANNIFETPDSQQASANLDGTGFVLNANVGPTSMTGTWGSTNGRQDFYLQTGALAMNGCYWSTAQAGTIFGNLFAAGTIFGGSDASAVVLETGGSIAWNACSLQGSVTNLYSGGPNAVQSAGAGTSGSLVMGPAVTATVTSNAGTIPVSANVANFKNSSSATMAITMATSGAIDGQQIIVRVYDFAATAETIGWTNTENSTATVPTTSNGSTTLPKTVTFQYNAATSKWRCIASV